MIDTIFENVINMSVSAGIIAIIVILLRFVLKNKMPKKMLPVLWAVVFFKLIFPFSLPSPNSIFNAKPLTQITQQIERTITHDKIGTTETQSETVSNASNTESEAAQSSDTDDTNNLADVLPVIWLSVTLLLLLLLAAGYIFTYIRFKSGVKLRNGVINELIRSDYLKRKIGVYKSSAVKSPVVFGIFVPKIYLPVDFTIENESALRLIMAHEMEHIRRFDNLFNFIMLFLLCVHWFNPAVWFSIILSSRDIEAACDEGALNRLGEENKNEYAYLLVSAADNSRKHSPALFTGFGESFVKSRVKEILKYKFKTATVLSAAAAVVIIAAVVAVFATGAFTNNDFYVSSSHFNGGFDSGLFVSSDSNSYKWPQYVQPFINTGDNSCSITPDGTLTFSSQNGQYSAKFPVEFNTEHYHIGFCMGSYKTAVAYNTGSDDTVQILYSDDLGKNWVQSTPIPLSDYNVNLNDSADWPGLIVDFATAECGYLSITYDNGTSQLAQLFFTTSDGGKSWVFRDFPINRPICGIYFLNSKVGFITSNEAPSLNSWIYRTEDSGKTWTEYTLQVSEYVDNSLYSTSIPDTPYFIEGTGYLPVLVSPSTQAKYIFFTTRDNGKTWVYDPSIG